MEQQGCRPRPSFRDRHNAVQIYDRACSGLDGEQRAELVQSQPSGDMTESIDGFRVMTVGGTLWLMDELHFPMNMTFTQALRLRVYLGTLPGLGLDDPQVSDTDWTITLWVAVKKKLVHVSHMFPRCWWIPRHVWRSYTYWNLLVITRTENLAIGDKYPPQAFSLSTEHQRQLYIEIWFDQWRYPQTDSAESLKKAAACINDIIRWYQLDIQPTQLISMFGAQLPASLVAPTETTQQFVIESNNRLQARQQQQQQLTTALQQSGAQTEFISRAQQQQWQSLSDMYLRVRTGQQQQSQFANDISLMVNRTLNLRVCSNAQCNRVENCVDTAERSKG